MTADQKQDAANRVRPSEVHIVAHSMLFYWWPVWAVGLLLAGLTWLGRVVGSVRAGWPVRVVGLVRVASDR